MQFRPISTSTLSITPAPARRWVRSASDISVGRLTKTARRSSRCGPPRVDRIACCIATGRSSSSIDMRLASTIHWEEPLTYADAAVYLLGPVLGFVMRLRGIVPLHASAVMIGTGATVFVGDAGAGKSTTAGAFAALGYGVLSDDLLPLMDNRRSYLRAPEPSETHDLAGFRDRTVWIVRRAACIDADVRQTLHRPPKRTSLSRRACALGSNLRAG